MVNSSVVVVSNGRVVVKLIVTVPTMNGVVDTEITEVNEIEVEKDIRISVCVCVINVVVVVKKVFVCNAVIKLKKVLVVNVVLLSVPTMTGEVTKKTWVVWSNIVLVDVVVIIEVIDKEDVVVVTLMLSSVEKKVLVVTRSEVMVRVEAMGIVSVVNSVTTSSSKNVMTTRVGLEKSGIGVSGVQVCPQTRAQKNRERKISLILRYYGNWRDKIPMLSGGIPPRVISMSFNVTIPVRCHRLGNN